MSPHRPSARAGRRRPVRRRAGLPGLVGLLAVLVGVALAVGIAGPPSAAAPRTALDNTNYPAGWNLVSTPTGSTIPGASSPYYAWGTSGSDYVAVAPGETVGGRAVWAYFASDASVPQQHTAADYTRAILPGQRWVLVGDPSTSQTLPISGADSAVAYDSTQAMYVSIDSVRPGQGVWVYRNDPGVVMIGQAPSGAQADTAARLQAALQQNPTDRSSVDTLAQTAAGLLSSRQYDAAQATMDDLRAAAEDGLRSMGAGVLPTMDQVQIDSAAGIRDRLADAQAAVAAGDTARADTDLMAAQNLAQTATQDAVAKARQQGSSSSSSADGRWLQAPNNLAAFGALLRTAFFASGLGTPVGDTFWSVANAVLTGAPIPPAPGMMSSSSPAAPTIDSLNCTAPNASMINVGDSINCTASVHGTVTGITWSAPNGSPASGTGVTFGTSFSSSGVQSIMVTACNGSACNSQSQNVTIAAPAASSPTSTAPTAPTIDNLTCTAPNPNVISPGDTIMCTVTAHGTISNIFWSAPNGNPVNGSGPTFSTSYSAAGQQTITVSVCNVNSCATGTATLVVVASTSSTTHPGGTTSSPTGPTSGGGGIQITEQDIGCAFSAMPSTAGSIMMTITSSSAGGPGQVTGSLSGGGSGSRQVSCNGTTATLTWSAKYSGTFTGTYDPSSGAVTLTGSISISQQMTASNCSSAAGKQMTCQQPSYNPNPTYTMHLTGTVNVQTHMGAGNIVIDSGCSTTGTWRVTQ